jgi:hypothetical protein
MFVHSVVPEPTDGDGDYTSWVKYARIRARLYRLNRVWARSMYLWTHSCTKVANMAEARLSTRLANQNACVALGVDAGVGGGGRDDGRAELLELRWSW